MRLDGYNFKGPVAFFAPQVLVKKGQPIRTPAGPPSTVTSKFTSHHSFRNSRINRAVSAGASRKGKWPASGRHANCPFGIRDATA